MEDCHSSSTPDLIPKFKSGLELQIWDCTQYVDNLAHHIAPPTYMLVPEVHVKLDGDILFRKAGSECYTPGPGQ